MPLPNRGRFNSGKTPGSGGPPFKQRRIITRQDSSGMDPTTVKYIVFFLIFVVGNIILFFSTGHIIIPR